MESSEESATPESIPEPSWIVYPVGVLMWAFVGGFLLTTIPPEAQSSSTGIVLFLLPLGMAVLAAFLNLFTRPERSPAMRSVARTLTFACLWPFVAWGQWDARARRRRLASLQARDADRTP